MEFPSLRRPAIIALKGLPSTCKTFMAASLGKWAGAPVLRIDDFLDSLDGDEPERLQRAAFVSLCKVAASQLLYYITNFKCVVIKSRLCSTFELDQLIDLAGLKDTHKSSPNPLLIIECQINNKYRWQEVYKGVDDIFGIFLRNYERKWYRPKEWDEVEKVILDYDAQAWDRYFLESIEQLSHERRRLVGRMVFDTSTFLLQTPFGDEIELNDSVADAIKYLLTETVWDRFQHSVGYQRLLQTRMEDELNTPRERSKYLCTERLGCVFKYREALEDHEGGNCGVCEERIMGPGYACHFCTLALHRSCAEDISVPGDFTFPKKYACDSCKHHGRDFSFECKACALQTNLKCRTMPTIIKHDAHPQHFLCMRLEGFSYRSCEGCRYATCDYACKICQCLYCLDCMRAPGQARHNHGGYEHVMKLMYSTDGMEGQEDFWCDICHRDIDPQLWFFSCQDCPYYVTHRKWDGSDFVPCNIRQ